MKVLNLHSYLLLFHFPIFFTFHYFFSLSSLFIFLPHFHDFSLFCQPFLFLPVFLIALALLIFPPSFFPFFVILQTFLIFCGIIIFFSISCFMGFSHSFLYAFNLARTQNLLSGTVPEMNFLHVQPTLIFRG